MATPTQWLGATQVNTGLAATGNQSDSKIIGLANNTFLVIWTEASNGVIAPDPSSDIVGKIYAADGTVLRDAFRVNTDRTSDTEHLPDISATHDGFVMAYVDQGGGGTNQSSII